MIQEQLRQEGYENQQILWTGQRSLVIRASGPEKPSVIIKTLNLEYPDSTEISRFQYEFEILRKLNSERVVKATSMLRFGHTLAFTMEDNRATSLEAKKYPLREALCLAREAALAVSDIHEQRVIHKDINPGNFIRKKNSEHLWLIDFGISSILPSGIHQASHSDPEGTLPYLAPEQTGRMNRCIDYRTDYYSLGAMYYLLFTGRYLFDGIENDAAWIHAHLSRNPISMCDRNPEIPVALDQMVSKLLMKNAEDRYQNIQTLIKDLNQCIENYDHYGHLNDVVLIERDVPEVLTLPDHVLGRESERQLLLDSFNRVCLGHSEYVAVSGFAGIGKTSLVGELRRFAFQANTIIATGKYSDHFRSVPYKGLSTAISQLIQFKLSGDPDALANLSKSIKEALGDNLGLVTALFTDLELIVGAAKEVPDLNPEKNSRRFIDTFKRFLECFASPDSPLIIFLDDMQWADMASIQVLEKICEKGGIRYCQILLSFRENEVSKEHILRSTLSKIESHAQLEWIRLDPMNESVVCRYLSQILYQSEKNVKSFAAKLWKKTNGNPFFLGELIKQLYHQGAIKFGYRLGEWCWDESAVSDSVSENVVELLVNTISELSAECREVLNIGSVIGFQFNWHQLSALSRLNDDQIRNSLIKLLEHGFILPLGHAHRMIFMNDELQADGLDASYQNGFRFRHDRIWQAAYLLSSEKDLSLLHYHLAMGIIKRSEAEPTAERLSDIVSHLHQGKEHLRTVEASDLFIKYSLEVAKNAISAGAYQAAFEVLDQAAIFVNEVCWGRLYELAWNFQFYFATCCFAIFDEEKGLTTCQLLLKKSKTTLEKSETWSLLPEYYSSAGQFHKSLKSAVEALKLLGLSASVNPSWIVLIPELLYIRAKLSGNKGINFLNAQKLTDKRASLMVKIYESMIYPCYGTENHKLYLLCTLRILKAGIRHGKSGAVAYALGNFAMIIGEVFGNYQESEKYAKMAISLSAIPEFRSYRIKALIAEVSFHLFKYDRYYDAFEVAEEALKCGIETGDTMSTALVLSCSILLQSCPVLPLPQIIERAKKYQNYCLESGYPDCKFYSLVTHQIMKNLMGLTRDRLSPSDSQFNFDVWMSKAKQDGHFLMQTIGHSMMMQIYYFYGEYEGAWQYKQMIRGQEKNLMGTIGDLDNCILGFLLCVALWNHSQLSKKVHLYFEMKRYRKKIKKLNRFKPKIFGMYLSVMDASFARIKGDFRGAANLYQKAISEANDFGYLRFQALFSEISGEFYLESGLEDIAGMHFSEALYIYEKWGAVAKVEHLKELYEGRVRLTLNRSPRRSVERENKKSQLIDHDFTGIINTRSIDLDSVAKVGQALAKEVRLPSLIRKILQIVRENAGADKVCLILKRQDLIEVQGYQSGDEDVRLLEGVSIDDYADISTSLIRKANLQMKPLVIDNAASDLSLAQDPYVQNHTLRSVLVVPVIKMGKVFGFIYAENSLTKGAFTFKHLEVINLISSQLAISVENAFLYQDLEEKVQRRTLDLAEKNLKLEKALSENTNLVRILCHDLNNSVFVIDHSAKLLQKYSDDSLKIKKYTHVIGRASENLKDMIENVREAEALKSGKKEVCLSSVSLGEIFEKAKIIFSARMEQKNITLRIDAENHDQIYVMAEKISFSNQVINNLISNAIKFSNPGQEIKVVIEPSIDELVTIRICDQGIGIPKAIQKVLFSHDVKTSRPGTGGEKGTGFGMPLVKAYMDQFGGQIQIDSRDIESFPEDHGTEFILILKSGNSHIKKVS